MGRLLLLIVAAFAAVLLHAAEPLPVAAPLGLPVTAERIELGKKLFFDPRLSVADVSCSTCHDPDKGWADKNMVAVGVFGRRGTRNSPTIINAVYSPLMFHDGREIGQPAQSLLPLENRLEMGQQTEEQVFAPLSLIPGYRNLFLQAYGRLPDATTVSHAIASFETQVVSYESPIDFRLEGNADALTPEAEIGFGLFEEAKCMSCHKPPLYSDYLLHNNGMEFATTRFNSQPDPGRAGVVQRNRVRLQDVRAFKTATLREVARTAPYGHAGQFRSLHSVVRHYNLGGARAIDGQRDPAMDSRIRPRQWNVYQELCLVKFLEEAFQSESYPYFPRPALP